MKVVRKIQKQQSVMAYCPAIIVATKVKVKETMKAISTLIPIKRQRKF